MWLTLLILTASALVACAATFVLLRRGEALADRLLIAWVPAAIWVWLALSILRIAEQPLDRWNWHACRLAPVVAMTRGVPLYNPADFGPISSHIYGPVWAIAMLPAALGKSVTSIILIGGVLTLTWYFVPLAILIARGAGATTTTLAAWSACALWTLADPALQGAAYWVHVDAVALGFSAIACGALIPSNEQQTPRACALLVSAVCGALAVWTKQTFAPIMVVLPAFLWLRDGRGPALRFTLMLLTGLIALSGIFLFSLGGSNMMFNMFTVPSHHPLKGGDAVLSIMEAAGRTLMHAAVPLVLLEFLLIHKSHRRVRPLNAWLRHNRWALPALLGIALAPTAILGYAKVGGHPNNLSGVVYFLMAAASICAARHATRFAKLCLLVLALAGIGLTIRSPKQLAQRIESVKNAHPNPQQQAYEVALKHPNQLWLPWNTLSTLLADGRLYHFDYGLFDRRLAGSPPTRTHLMQCTPSNLRMIAIPQGAPSQESRPQGIEPVQLPELPGFDVYMLPAD